MLIIEIKSPCMAIEEQYDESPWDTLNILNHVHCPVESLLKKNDILLTKKNQKKIIKILVDLQGHCPSLHEILAPPSRIALPFDLFQSWWA